MPASPVTIKSNLLTASQFSVHAEGDKSPLARPFKHAYNELRAIDGFKEFASVFGQVFPKLGQSIATLGIVVPATPFVAIGAAKAIEESIDQFTKHYPDVLLDVAQQRGAIMEELRAEGRSPSEIADIEAKLDKALAYLRNHGSDKLRFQIDQYERTNSFRKTAHLERDAGVLGAGGMTLMAAGMVPLAMQAAAGIVEHSANTIFWEGMLVAKDAAIAGTVAGTVASGILAPAHIAMAVKDAVRSGTGIRRDMDMKHSSEAIGKLAEHPELAESMSHDAKESAQELYSKMRYFNAHHSIASGALTATGQSLMAAGSIATLSGAGAIVGAPLAVAGAIPTVVGSVERAVYLKKEKRALGAEASTFAKQKKLDLAPTIGDAGMSEAVRTASSSVTRNQNDIVRSKLHSLIQQTFDEEAKSGKAATEYERMHAVELLAGTAKKSRFTGTTLLKGDIEKLKPLLWNYYEKGFFAGDIATVQRRLDDKAVFHFSSKKLVMTDKAQNETLKKTVRDVVKDNSIDPSDKGAMALGPNGRRKDVTVQQVVEATRKSEQVNDVFRKHLTKSLIAQVKTDSKYLRHDAVDKLATAAVSATAHTNRAKADAALAAIPSLAFRGEYDKVTQL